MPRDSDGACGHEHPFGERGLVRELDLVAARGDAARRSPVRAAVAAGQPIRRSGRASAASSSTVVEPDRQPAEHEGDALAVDVRLGERCGEQRRGRRYVGRIRPASMCRPGSSIRSAPPGPSTPVGTPTTTDVPRRPRAGSAGTGTRPRARPDWSGCATDRRVEQRRRLHRELMGEAGPDQAAALLGQLGIVGHAVGDPLVVRQQRRRADHDVGPRSGRAPAASRPGPPARTARGSGTITPDARDRPSSESSCPGTNRRAEHARRIGRAGRTSVRVTHGRHRTVEQGRGPGLLQGREQRERRLRTLVLVAPVRLQPVAAAAAVRVEHAGPGVVDPEEPATGRGRSPRPSAGAR